MVESYTVGGHVPEESLSLHFAGALTPAESDAVHGHLQQCPGCQAKADRICDLVATLTLLTADDGGAPEPAVPPAPARTAPPRSGPTRPTGAPRAGRPANGPRRSRRAAKLFHASLLLVVTLGLAGLGLAAVQRHEPAADVAAPPAVTAAAESTDADTGAMLAVTVKERPGGSGVSVRATVTGLRPGDWYMLFATGTDGRTHVVTEWTATPLVQHLSGDVGVGVGDLRQLVVTERDGTPVVTANLSTGAPGRVLTR